MPPIDSPARRVLGDKTTNASLRSESSTKTWKNPSASHDNLSVSFGDSTRSSKTSTHLKSPRAGQKRRHEEVDVQDQTESQQSTDTQPLSQMTDVLSEGSSQMDEMMVDSTNNTRSTAQTSLTSFQASQTDHEPADVQFEIHEEMSQRTLDKMHEIALPQNASQPATYLRPSLLKDVSNVSVSMSSLIDFDEDKDSQPSDGLRMIDQPDKKVDEPEVSRAKSEEETRKDMLSEKAEALRTRLQLAFFKVSTNQTSKPFSRLNHPRSKSPELPPQPLSSSPMSSPPSRQAHFTPLSPESIRAIARARATMQAKPRVQTLDKLPHPTIVPTGFSARLQIHSSPPPTTGNEAPVPMSLRPGTPSPPAKSGQKNGKRDLPRTPMQLSSPPGSPVEITTAAKRLRGNKNKYGGLTSSVVKGEAANGLLELMRGASGTLQDDEDDILA